MKVLLDTNVVLDLLLDREDFAEYAKEIVKTILEIFNVADVNMEVLLASLENSGSDYEDSVIYTSAEFAGIDYIVSRDLKGFKKSKIKTLAPKEFLDGYLKNH